MSFLNAEDLSRSCRVCKSLQALIDSPDGQEHWKTISEKEGVPLVEVVKGRPIDYKGDFRFLRPITISGKIIGRYLGEVVGKVPRIRLDSFLRLKQSQDSFEPARPMRETHVVIVDPSALKITVSPNRPLDLDETGTLVEIPVAERAQIVNRDLIVPFSFKNLRMLAAHPLAGGENTPVFDPNSWSEVFDQCNAPSAQNGILIMRREVVARNLPFDGEHGQQALVRSRGWEVVTVRQRGFFNTIKILETGTCSDGRAPWTYARGPEIVHWQGEDYEAALGGFAPRVGVFVSYHYYFVRVSVGVVPGGPAEVLRPLELEDLEID